MNPLAREFFSSVLRKALTIFATYLVAEGWLEDDPHMEQYIAGLALLIVSFGWSFWNKYKNRLAFLVALAAPAGTDEATVRRWIKEGAGTPNNGSPTISSSGCVLLLAAGLTAISCASVPTKPVSQVAFYGGRTLEAIHALQVTVSALEAQRLLSTDAAAQVMIATHTAGETGQKLADLLQAYDAATGAVKQGMVPDIGALVSTLDALLARVTQVDLGPARDQITQLVNNVLLLITQLRAAVPGLMRTPTTGSMIGFRYPVGLPQLTD